MSELPTVPMEVFLAEVVRAEDLSPHLRRVVLGGPGLAAYRSTGMGDEYVRLLFPKAGETEPTLPQVVDGALDYESIDLGQLRTYTVRAFDEDRHEVTVDFVVHDGGVAAAWAMGAAPGDKVGLNSPTGLYQPPTGLEWQILVADLAGLPALARLLEQTPPTVASRVVVEVPTEEDRIDLPPHPRATVTWVVGGNGQDQSRLGELVESLPRPDGVGYVWVAGESAALRAVRRHLRRELRLPSTAFKAVGYWIDHAEEWRARYDALDESTRAELAALWEQDRNTDDIELEYDARLTALGL